MLNFFFLKFDLSDQNFIIENIGLTLMLIIIFVVILRVSVGILCVWKFASFSANIQYLLFKTFLKFYSVYELKNENEKKRFFNNF